jgi:hypothetical protein
MVIAHDDGSALAWSRRRLPAVAAGDGARRVDTQQPAEMAAISA